MIINFFLSNSFYNFSKSGFLLDFVIKNIINRILNNGAHVIFILFLESFLINFLVRNFFYIDVYKRQRQYYK